MLCQWRAMIYLDGCKFLCLRCHVVNPRVVGPCFTYMIAGYGGYNFATSTDSTETTEPKPGAETRQSMAVTLGDQQPRYSGTLPWRGPGQIRHITRYQV